MKSAFLFYAAVLLWVIVIANSLECRRSCVFLPYSIEDDAPGNSCPTVTREDIECTVFVEVNHQTRRASGSLSARASSHSIDLRMETVVKLDSTVFSTFRYACMRNNCDVEFLDELFSHLRNISLTAVNDTVYSIFDPLWKGVVNCTNEAAVTCNNTLCQASFDVNATSDGTVINSIKDLTCSPSRNDNLLNIKNVWSSDTNSTEMIMRCNRENCIDNRTAEEVHQFIWNTNILTLVGLNNLDNENSTKPTSIGSSSLMLSHGLIIGITLFLLP